MPRPKRRRRIAREPHCSYFKPAGVPVSALEVVLLGVDELEAIRLADYEGLYQEDAAIRLGVSRQTFGRIVASARKKVAEALTKGKAIRIEGGVIEMSETRTFRCAACAHEWVEPFGTGLPDACPKCGSSDFRRADVERGMGGGGSEPGAGRGSGLGQGRGQGGGQGRGQGGGQGRGRGKGSGPGRNR